MSIGESLESSALPEPTPVTTAMDPGLVAQEWAARTPAEVAFVSIVPDSIDRDQRAASLVLAIKLIGASLRHGNTDIYATRLLSGVERPGSTPNEVHGRRGFCYDMARQQFFVASGLGHLTVAREESEPTSEETLVIAEMHSTWKSFYSNFAQGGSVGVTLRRETMRRLEAKGKSPFTHVREGF